ncbi:MAG: helix-turn-helix domain-containing protein [Ruminococcaceae bacterium]|nr:helix-turn-helix domain-containing protein [Oscillospiraceae bacterium]
MNDYKFGEYIYKLRTEADLSQAQLAEKLGVSDKAVSKWENGKAKPQIDMLKKLAIIFGVQVEEMLDMPIETTEKQITKIVITGGPCAGKTTGMSWVQNAFTEMGYVVLFVPETATELISGGVAPWTLSSNLDYQLCQMKLQLHKETVFEEAAKKIYNSDKILIVCDRGMIDNKAYMSDGEFKSALSKLQLNETELRDSYDAVFHLVTAAKGAEEFYTLSNNKARTETIEEASIMDDKLISAWTGHPHFRVIDNSKGFEDKMKQLVAEISSFLGEPEPFEIERKFLIEYPDIKELEKKPNCKKVEIIQTYLNADNGDEIRVRQRGKDGNYIYFKTIKKKVDNIKRVEIETRLTKDEYLTHLMDADTAKRQIRKNRYCLTYDSQYFEIDIYPFWNDKAILEIELSDEKADVSFPDFIKIIKEVTDDDNYKNASLANI